MTSVARGEGAIGAAFERARRAGRTALVTYLVAGYPSPDMSLEAFLALESCGADIIELGVPFSDPVADGAAIQAASQIALHHGVTPTWCLELVRSLRRHGLRAPLVLMGYYNPIVSHGVTRYVAEVASAGADGLIVPDLPPEEAGALRQTCQQQGLALIFLAAPTTGPQRLARIARETSGFLYLVSRLGTTGGDGGGLDDLGTRLGAVRQVAHTPVAVGFGIARPEQAAALSQADGVVVGSALVERAAEGIDALGTSVSAFASALRPAPRP